MGRLFVPSDIFALGSERFLEALAQLIYQSLQVVDGLLLFVDNLIQLLNKKVLVRDFNLNINEAFFCDVVRFHVCLCREFLPICHAFFGRQDFLLPSLRSSA